MRYPHRVTRHRAPLTAGGYNTDTRDWGSASSVTLPALLQPLGSTEELQAQNRVEARWRCHLPAGSDVLPTDRLEHDGRTFEIDGDPKPWADMNGRAHHVELLLVQVRQEV